ncbi:hypothetical protein PR048_011080 [Dryococelus australis]|uniref:PiggyBac transposable element-derived protein domain-containing protein n=1 Tax=Dryococelus australis TaxID=614101 RepID=A0ABQ9HKK4_9NEOP|nr:hypothetical protein PR048_011080 [Dryococelus australis]
MRLYLEFCNLLVSFHVIVSLLNSLLVKRYCVTTDNFYTLPQLEHFLIQHKTDTYRTVRLSWKNVTNCEKPWETKAGDKKGICLLSTIHNSEMVELKRRNNIMKKPKLVVDYNHTMGDVDRVDQHFVNYPIQKKREKKFTKKFCLLEQAL